jgi:hypothetical protein
MYYIEYIYINCFLLINVNKNINIFITCKVKSVITLHFIHQQNYIKNEKVNINCITTFYLFL